MKKMIIATAVVCAMAFGLTACGGSDSSGSSQAASSSAPAAAEASSTEAESAPAETETAAAGETYDVGKFTVLIPEGWMASPQSDVFGEKDEDGNYPLSTEQIGIIKGGEDATDVFSKPTIYIYYNEGNAESSIDFTKAFYDEASDMSVSINGKECAAFEAKSASFSDEEKFYVYDIVFYQISDSDYIQFTIPVDMVDYEGVSIDDPDVVAIMESVQLK